MTETKLYPSGDLSLNILHAAFERADEEEQMESSLLNEKAIEEYRNIIDFLKESPGSAIEHILAALSFTRLMLANANVFPNDIIYNDSINHSKLEQYILPLSKQVRDMPKSGPTNEILNLCARIWYFTVIGLLAPSIYGDHTKAIWQELERGSTGAHSVFMNKFYPVVANEIKLQPLLESIEKDIKKIPAALLKSKGT